MEQRKYTQRKAEIIKEKDERMKILDINSCIEKSEFQDKQNIRSNEAAE